MEKRLTRTDYLFAIMFIFMLVVALGAFFYGLKVGKEKSAMKYEEQIAKQNEATKELTAYHQQHLVSFYHTIYQPYKEFQKKWFDQMYEIDATGSADASGIMKDLGKLASDKYDALSKKTMPDSSPLLQEGLQNYLKSLKLFSEAAKNFQSKANSMKGTDLLAEIEKDAYFTEAKTFTLKAQKNYYDAMVEWNKTIDPQFKPADTGKRIGIKDWSQLNLNMKNDYIAAVMLNGKTFKPYTPQDLTAKIDDLIASGQAKKMNYGEVQQAVDVLVATEAVRPGDFIRQKNKLYGNENLPQVPFFFSQD
ncbi:hypothetical protein [Paenibacillus hamazuiensis]|uniref:hypothetical protein n=1 Tax=Paenibacillus hamazuiensis TaxID=2936508 RepID=UPI00200D04F0|nr:hypothetical protein [Paenibacillus hamazuiensis]